MTGDLLAAQLRDLVGEAHVLTDPEMRAGYETDWTRRYRGSAPFLDLRRFERTDRGEMLPTRQGVTIRGHEVLRLLSSLVKLEASREAG